MQRWQRVSAGITIGILLGASAWAQAEERIYPERLDVEPVLEELEPEAPPAEQEPPPPRGVELDAEKKPGKTTLEATVNVEKEPELAGPTIAINVLGAVKEQQAVELPLSYPAGTPGYRQLCDPALSNARQGTCVVQNAKIHALVSYLLTRSSGFQEQAEPSGVYFFSGNSIKPRDQTEVEEVRRVRVRLKENFPWADDVFLFDKEFCRRENGREECHLVLHHNDVMFIKSQTEQDLAGYIRSGLGFVLKLASNIALPIILALRD